MWGPTQIERPVRIVEAGEVIRVRPRYFRQYGTAIVKIGDEMLRSHDCSVWKALMDEEQVAWRAVQKSGKPLGPWFFISGNYAFRVDQ